ncbi:MULTISPECIES: AimR family lysis-lysogeny pheromone receptor [Bacillus cereus group]|uniref:AimR family lysis-lysogeny pheromone receptor n=1 Tax=Bacillus cereus group TaxID=86661 RepID=UPI00101FD6CB|nr:AimR family lysis-lysogeny pheromone receptor [Bacillus albus]
MNDFLNVLKKELYSAGINNTQLALSWGISPSGVTAIFKGKRKMRFSYLTKSLSLLNRGTKTEQKFVCEYMRAADPKPKSKREIMEYLTLKGDFDTLKILVDEEKNSSTSLNKEFSMIYELIHQRFTEDIKLLNFYNLMREKNKKTTCTEMKTLVDLILCQTLYQSGNHELIAEKMHEIDSSIFTITNNFFQSTLGVRYKEAQAVLSLRNNEIEKARKLCYDILDECEKNSFFILPKAIAYFKLGESYILDSNHYDTSKQYLLKAYETLSGLGNFHGIKEKREMILQNLAFLKIYNMKELYSIVEIDEAEIAFLKIKQGYKQEGKEMLMKLKEKNGFLSGIQTVYLALSQDNEEDRITLMKEALDIMISKGDKFYAQIPKEYLGIL